MVGAGPAWVGCGGAQHLLEQGPLLGLLPQTQSLWWVPVVGSLGGFPAPRLRPFLGFTTGEGDTTPLMELQGYLLDNLMQNGTKLNRLAVNTTLALIKRQWRMS